MEENSPKKFTRRELLKAAAAFGTLYALERSGISKLFPDKVSPDRASRADTKEYEVSLLYEGDSFEELQQIIDRLTESKGVAIKLSSSVLKCPERYYKQINVPLADGDERVPIGAGLVIPPECKVKIEGLSETEGRIDNAIGVYVSDGATLELENLTLSHGKASPEQAPLQEDAYIFSDNAEVRLKNVTINADREELSQSPVVLDGEVIDYRSKGMTGLYLYRSEGILESCYFNDMAWDAITVNRSQANIVNCNIRGTNRTVEAGAGVGLVHGSHASIDNTQILRRVKSVILFGDSTAEVNNSTIVNDHGSNGYLFSDSGGLRVRNSRLVTSSSFGSILSPDSEFIDNEIYFTWFTGIDDESEISERERYESYLNSMWRGDPPLMLSMDNISGFRGNQLFYTPPIRDNYLANVGEISMHNLTSNGDIVGRIRDSGNQIEEVSLEDAEAAIFPTLYYDGGTVKEKPRS